MSTVGAYERIDRDAYMTPAWVVEQLCEAVRFRPDIWEPACGTGNVVRALWAAGYEVAYGDIADHGMRQAERLDFLTVGEMPDGCASIVTNPPYADVARWVEHALDLTRPRAGMVALLLNSSFDAAQRNRRWIDHPAFAAKLQLTRRIRWIEDSKGSPVEKHAWFLWDWSRQPGPGVLRLLPAGSAA